MSVELLYGNIESRIVGYLPDAVHQDLHNVLSYKVEGVQYSRLVKMKKWDGVTRLYKKAKGQSFYTGLLSLVAETLDKHKIPYTKRDIRVRPEANLPHLVFSPTKFYEQRDYQQFSIQQAYQRTRGILKIATGGGKTSIVCEIVGKIKTGPFMFYVLTQELLDQAYEALSSSLNEPIGRIGAGHCDIKMINVCMVQTAIRAINLDNKMFNISDYSFDEEDTLLWKTKDIESAERLAMIRKVIQSSKGLYFDETHHAAAQTARDVICASPNAYWRFGGSATPWREDGSDILLQALLGRKIVDINASYLIERGFLCEPYIIFEDIEHDCKLHSFKAIYKECITGNDAFNAHVADTADYLIEKGLSTLILVQHYQQGEAIKKLLKNVEFVSGKMADSKRKQAISDLREKKSLCMIATTLADEGLDIPTLDVALLAGGGASSTRFNQRVGRTLRIDKKNPRNRSLVIYYNHKVKYLEKHAKKAKKIAKTESRFNIVESQGPLYIKSEIDHIMQLDSTQKTLFC